jgi:hypothetical protein
MREEDMHRKLAEAEEKVRACVHSPPLRMAASRARCLPALRSARPRPV